MRRTDCLPAIGFGLIAALLTFSVQRAAVAQPSGSDEPAVVRLTVEPKAPARPAPSLLPPEKDRTDGNRAEQYEDAAAAVSKVSSGSLSGTWTSGPVENLAREEAAEIVGKAKPVLDKLDKAARCRECKWDPPPSMQRLSDYRSLARHLALQVRLSIAEKRYDDAVHGLQTGLALARDLGQGTELIQTLVGIAIGELMLEQAGELIGSPGAPNLYAALTELPSPLVNLDHAIQRDLDNLKKQNPLIRGALRAQLTPSHDRARLLAMRLDRTIAALRCIEAIRWYAATHKGKLPKSLKDIKQAPVPNDPVTSRPFEYEAAAADRAVIAGPPPKGGSPSDAVRYELKLGRD